MSRIPGQVLTVVELDDPLEQIRYWLPVAITGSREALGRLLQASHPYLKRIADEEMDEFLRKKVDPADVVQQTFLEAIRDFSQFDGSPITFLGWMRRLLLNNLANLHRDYLRAKRSVNREVDLPDRPSQFGLQFSAEQTPPVVKVMRHECNQALEEALSRLPEDYRTVIHLRSRELLTFEAIAESMGRSENAIRKLFARAMTQLYQEIDSSLS